MHCDNIVSTSGLVDPTSEIGHPLSIVLPSVSPSQSLSSETPLIIHNPPQFHLQQTVDRHSGQISTEELHMAMIGKQDHSNFPTAVTISPGIQDQTTSTDVDGISLQALSKSMPLPRPTRENVLRRLSEALMRKSLTMVRLDVLY